MAGRRDKNLDHPTSDLCLKPLQSSGFLCSCILIPQRAVREGIIPDLEILIDTAFAMFALGWHYEAGIQFVRLMLAGVFINTLICGSSSIMGEVILFYLERLNLLARVAQLSTPRRRLHSAKFVRDSKWDVESVLPATHA